MKSLWACDSISIPAEHAPLILGLSPPRRRLMKKTGIEQIASASTAIHRLRLRAATVRERLACAPYQTLKHLVYLLIALVPLVLVPPAFPQSTTAGVRLQAGFAK